jgi:hypothetical protein
MQARIVGYVEGAGWLPRGWRMFRTSPLGWLAIVFAYWLLMTFVSVVPLVGVVAAAVLVPPFSVGFMAAGRAAERGASVELPMLFEGFRHAVQQQLLLGAFYFLCIALVLGATMAADGGELARWMLSGQRPSEEVLHSDAFFTALVAAVALYLPVMMLFWFAPLLVAWHSATPVKALFFSFVACLMNWRAFIAYGAVTALVTVLLPLALASLLLLATAGGARFPVLSLAFPLLILLLPTLFASFYASYRDVFASPA